MAFSTPALNVRAAARHSRAARLPRTAPSYTASDGISLLGGLSTWATWYRDMFLPSQLGQLVSGTLSAHATGGARAGKIYATLVSGDLEDSPGMVELR